MSWLRLYNGDFVRMLPWTVLMDELTNQWSLEDAVKYILKESLPGPYDGKNSGTNTRQRWKCSCKITNRATFKKQL